MGKELLSTYNSVPGNGVLFAGEKGILCSDCWGVGGVVKLKGEAKCRGVQDHAACKPVPVTLPRVPGQNHVGEWLTACKGGPNTFQGFETAAMVAEIAMVGMLALRFQPGVNELLHHRVGQRCPAGQGRARGRRHRTPPDAAEVVMRIDDSQREGGGRVLRAPLSLLYVRLSSLTLSQSLSGWKA